MTAATLLLATMLVWQSRSQLIAVQKVKRHTVVEVAASPADTGSEHAERFVIHDAWSSIPPATSGYLGIRYIALTRGLGALSADVLSSSGDHDSPARNEPTKPATARNLLDEFLPDSTRSNQSRS